MSKISNEKAICNTLVEITKKDKDIVILYSGSRGSASLTPFMGAYPDQFVEIGVAKQDLISVSIELAKYNKKSFAASPACLLSTRSYEQIKVGVVYSSANVKLIGISGDISYGALGMSHHPTQSIVTPSAIPDMGVYPPSDCFQTTYLVKGLLKDGRPTYIRADRNAVESIYREENVPFSTDEVTVLSRGRGVTITACGKIVKPALDAGRLLEESGINAGVADMYYAKPLDEEAVRKAAGAARLMVTMEEHALFGGLDFRVSQVVSACYPRIVVSLNPPDEPVITGTPAGAFEYYDLTGQGTVRGV